MTPSLERDISESKAFLAKLAAKLADYPADVQADLGSHMRAIAKQATCIVDGWTKGDAIEKPGLKQLLRPRAKQADKGLVVLGETFQAVFSMNVQNVCSVALIRQRYPDIAAECTAPISSERLNFAVRDR